MPSEIFYWLLNMSISSSIVGIIIVLLGKVRRIPRGIISLLWIVPFLRMWIPVGINSKYSLMSLISRFTTKTVTVYEGAAQLSMMNHMSLADTYFPVIYKVNLLEDVFKIATIVWLIIAAALIIAMFILYAVTKSELKDARHMRDNIYISDKITSPAVYGIFREKIIIPSIYQDDDLKYILMHEQAHIKRKDNLWRVVAILTACVHWFNPLSWLFLKSFLSSIELACDETVLKNCTDSEKKCYANTLLNCVESKSLYASAFGGAKVRVRIERILSYRKLSTLSVIGFIALSIVVCYVLLTNAT